jgi:nitrate reductase gamma subunit
MYAFLTGPALWMTFIIFIGGLIVRVGFLAGLSRERDRVFYNHANISWGLRSIFHWLLPLGSVSIRQQPIFALVFYVFHVCLLAVPLFLNAHNLLWDESFGVSLWSMSDKLADILAMVVIGCGFFLFVRRLVRPEVRILTSAWDYTLILLTVAPFVTGVLAYHQWGPYEVMLILHVLFSEVLLIVIPFSKLGHIILFFFTRAFIGFEMGERRGARTW